MRPGMAWKSTIPWVGGGAAFAVGFLWARRTKGPRGALPRLSPDVALEPTSAAGSLQDINLDPDVNLDEIARRDALHDMGDLNDDVDFDVDTKRRPVNVDMASDVNTTVGPSEHAVSPDEGYDALDAEDVGAAWLRRATETESSEEPDVMDALEGTHEVIEGDPSLLDLAREEPYGADQLGAPLAPYAGTHDVDIATELPVGTLDEAGNAEFHVALNPPDALEAPPTGTLSPTDEEMARRDAAHRADQRRSHHRRSRR